MPFLEELSFAPADPMRNYLLPWIGSLFVHVSWAHLISNLIFFTFFAWKCLQIMRLRVWFVTLGIAHLLILAVTAMLCWGGGYFFGMELDSARLLGASALVLFQVGFLIAYQKDKQAFLFLVTFYCVAFFSKDEVSLLTHFTHGLGLSLGLLYALRLPSVSVRL